jgi:hypothetical protein
MTSDTLASVTVAATLLLSASRRHRGLGEWSLMNRALEK